MRDVDSPKREKDAVENPPLTEYFALSVGVGSTLFPGWLLSVIFIEQMSYFRPPPFSPPFFMAIYITDNPNFKEKLMLSYVSAILSRQNVIKLLIGSLSQ